MKEKENQFLPGMTRIARHCQGGRVGTCLENRLESRVLVDGVDHPRCFRQHEREMGAEPSDDDGHQVVLQQVTLRETVEDEIRLVANIQRDGFRCQHRLPD